MGGQAPYDNIGGGTPPGPLVPTPLHNGVNYFKCLQVPPFSKGHAEGINYSLIKHTYLMNIFKILSLN